MPFEIRFDENDGVLSVRAYGTGSVHEGHEALHQVEQHPRLKPGMPILIDVRDLSYVASRDDVQRFARTYATRFPDHTVAFVTKPGVMFGVARAIEELAELDGATVMTFQNRHDAVDWLRHTLPRSRIHER